MTWGGVEREESLDDQDELHILHTSTFTSSGHAIHRSQQKAFKSRGKEDSRGIPRENSRGILGSTHSLLGH